MFAKKYQKFLESKKTFFHKTHQVIFYRSHQFLLFHYAFDAILLVIIAFSIFQIVSATTPNPGHPWNEIGDGVFTVTYNQTALRTYTFPDANATMLTTNAPVTVVQGGTGLATIADKTLLVTTALNTLSALTVPAGQSIRRNAGDTAFEAYTPATAGMTYPGSGIANSTGSAWGTSYTTVGSGTVVALATSPSFTTPTLGAATATSINGVGITNGGSGSLTVTGTASISGTSSGTNTGDQTLASLGAQAQLSGTGFVKASGTSITYDSTSYQPLLTNPVTGTGTTNYLAKFTGTSALGSSVAYDDGTNFGIGTSVPTNLVSLGGTTARTIWMERNTTAATAGQGLTLSSGGAIAGTANLAGGDLSLKSGISTGTGTSAMHFFTATGGVTGTTDMTPSEKMTILGNGNVGVGITSPTANLQVAQGTTSSGSVTTNGTTALVGVGTQFTNTFKVGDTLTVSGETIRTIATITDDTHLTSTVAFSTTASGLSYTLTGGTRLSVLGNGNVGIGTTNPSFIFDVQSPSNEIGRFLNTYATGGDSLFGFGDTHNNTIWSFGKRNTQDTFEITYNTATTTPTVRSGNLLTILSTGKVGIGLTSPTAVLNLKAGTATANTAPLKFTSGTNLATTEAGAVEYDGSHLYFTATNGGTRYQLDQQTGGGRLDQITAANTTASIDSLNNAITWNWSTASTQIPFGMTANALTSGTLLDLSSTATSTITSAGTNAGSLLDITESGAMTAFTGNLANINASGANAVGATGNALGINIAGTAQLMKGINFTDATTGNLGTTAGTSGGMLFSFTGTHTGYGFQLSDATVSGTAMIVNTNSLTTGTSEQIVGNGLSSGMLLDLESNGTAAAASQKGLNVALQGTNSTSGITTYGAYLSNTHAGTTSTDVGLYATASGGTTANYAGIFDQGRVLIGSTTESTSSAPLSITGTTAANGSSSALTGILGGYTFNPTAGGTQVGNRFVVTNSPTTTANTAVDELIRVVDNTSLANLVRGLDITANGGSNTAGTNTGLRAAGATFGVQASITGLAGAVSVPAALYGENTGTTQGDVLRLYSNTMTTATSFANFYQDTSTFSGTGLLMRFATGSGSFTGNFVDLQKNNTSMFKITNAGVVSMGLSATASTTAVCSGLANGTAPTAGVAYEIRDCSGAPAADYAEMYPVDKGIEYGDIVTTGTNIVNTYDVGTDGNIDWTKVKGNVSVLVKSNEPYQDNVIGIVSDNHGDFSSTGYNIKDTDNPMPVALNGRVPVKISNSSPSIKIGDYVTTSSDIGKATKAIKSGYVIGKALENWDPSSGKSTIMIFVNQGFYQDNSVNEFAGETSFDGLTYFNANVDFAKSIKFEDTVEFTVPPLFNSDTAGFAVIKAGSDKVDVVFDKPYVTQPIVTVNITFEDNGNSMTDEQVASFFGEDIKSVVVNKTQSKFTIEINKVATEDIKFSWIALAVKDPKIFESVISGLIISTPTSSPSTPAQTTSSPTPAVTTPAPTPMTTSTPDTSSSTPTSSPSTPAQTTSSPTPAVTTPAPAPTTTSTPVTTSTPDTSSTTPTSSPSTPASTSSTTN